MSLHLKAVSFDAHEPVLLARFWATALGWYVHDEIAGTVRLTHTDGTKFEVTFVQAILGGKLEKNRLHLDLTTTSMEDQAASVDQLLALGARHIDVGQGPDALHVVLADPEDNEFCVIEPSNSFLAGCGRLGSITCDGSPAVGYFWSAALGWPLVWDQDEETAIRAADGTGPFITWGPPVVPKVMRNRLHLDVVTSSADDLGTEVDRLVSLGASLAETSQSDGKAVVMFDPDDNEFCILASRASIET